MKRLREEEFPPLKPRIFHFLRLFDKPNPSSLLNYAYSITERWRGQVTKDETYRWFLAKQVLQEKGVPVELFYVELGPRLFHNDIIYDKNGIPIDLNQPLIATVLTMFEINRQMVHLYFTYSNKSYCLRAQRGHLHVVLKTYTKIKTDSLIVTQNFYYKTDAVLMLRLKTILDTLPCTEQCY